MHKYAQAITKPQLAFGQGWGFFALRKTMALTTLAVVNDMLGLLGERRVNALDEHHPLIPDAIAKLETAAAWVQADMWWFNVEYPTLTPQVGTGNLLVPNDTAACDSLTQYPRLAVRGNRLYNMDDVTDVFTSPIRVRLHRIVPFDDCPLLARAYIAARAKLDFQKDYDGDSMKAQILAQEIKESYARLHAEHIRNAKANILHRPSVLGKLQAIVGGRPNWQTSVVNRNI